MGEKSRRTLWPLSSGRPNLARNKEEVNTGGALIIQFSLSSELHFGRAMSSDGGISCSFSELFWGPLAHWGVFNRGVSPGSPPEVTPARSLRLDSISPHPGGDPGVTPQLNNPPGQRISRPPYASGASFTKSSGDE